MGQQTVKQMEVRNYNEKGKWIRVELNEGDSHIYDSIQRQEGEKRAFAWWKKYRRPDYDKAIRLS